MKMKIAALALGWCFLLAGFSRCTAEESNPGNNQPKYSPNVKQIIIVFKTHFDIGYTDLARNVINDYRTTMIDRTLAVIDQNRDLPRDQQFVWTIPGWPMSQVLWPGQDPQRRQIIEQALRGGNLAIHGLPFTTHTETLELEDLVRGLGFSSRIARQYSLELPRDGKMTDVCGHTWVMPTLLKHAGIDFFHIGANAANQKARVPNLFWWEGPDGSRVLTMYSGEYGTSVLPPPDWPHATWLALLSTLDNVGPPSPEYIRQTLDTIHNEAPNVKVKIGRLSDFSDALRAENPDLPVVRGDLSDVWIHGPMSAPVGCKIARNTRPRIAVTESLATLSQIWGLNEPDPTETIARAYEKSLLYGEHTWGLATQNYVRLAYGPKAWDELLTNGLPDNYRLCEESYDEHETYIKDAQSLIEPVLAAELLALAKNVNIDGSRIVVFNPLPWKRTGLV
jgi:alpha-mannosidase